ncbi:MAG: SDR family oxidoreductase [Labilithrix sp.]|nr:SDR family oxidoreductase [Labilithrix sp.]
MGDQDMRSRTCIVTGGNTGIGLETARGLAREGATVILACRDEARAEAARADIVGSSGAAGRVRVMPLDLASLASIRAFAAAFREQYGGLHVLVANAGVFPTKRETTIDGLELAIGTNHVGHFLLTQELLPQLVEAAPARIVVVSASLQKRATLDFEDLQFERRRFAWTSAYAASKLANVLFTVSLAERLAGTGVTVNALHPGLVDSELARHMGPTMRTVTKLLFGAPERGARTSLFLATDPSVAGVTGKYFEARVERPMNPIAHDRAARERLWTLTEEMIAAASRGAAPAP